MTSQALKTILSTVGSGPAVTPPTWKSAGEADPVLPTPFRIGETAAASLAAVGLAVSDLWNLRTGRDQEVGIDIRRATASLRSGRYLKVDGGTVAAERTPVMGVYPARNGRWSYLHCNFPNHRDAALGVLGVPEDREAVRRAVAEWDALELEEAIIAARGAGGMVRSMEGVGASIPSRRPWPLSRCWRSTRSVTALHEALPDGGQATRWDQGAGPDQGAGRSDLCPHTG